MSEHTATSGVAAGRADGAPDKEATGASLLDLVFLGLALCGSAEADVLGWAFRL